MKIFYLVLFFFAGFGYSNAQTPTATLTNNSGTNTDVNIAVGGTATLKVTFTGTGPWNFALFNEVSFQRYTAYSSPFLLSVSPSSKRRYSLGALRNNAGLGTVSGVLDVIVGTNPTLTLNTPTNLSACQGGTFEIPYSKSGTWPIKASILVDVLNPTNNNVAFGNVSQTFSGNPIKLNIPTSVSSGSYRIRIHSKKPYVTYETSSYTFSINPSSCQANQASIMSTDIGYCDRQILSAAPIGNGYSYEWFKDGVLLPNDYLLGRPNFNRDYYAYYNGDYTVRIRNSTTGYDQTSDVHTITEISNQNLVITQNQGIIPCGSIISVPLSSSLVGSNYRYQWSKLANNGSIIPIIGANTSTYTSTSIGVYYLDVYDGECQYSSSTKVFNTSGTTILRNSIGIIGSDTIPQFTSTNLSVSFTGRSPWHFELKGSDNSIRSFTTSTNPYLIPISPSQNTRYQVERITNFCGNGNSSNTISVVVSPPPTFAITSISALSTNYNILSSTNTNICPGSTIPVTYSIAGTWTADRELTVELLNASTNALIAGTTQMGFATNPILYHVPSTIAAGSYKIRLTSVKPFITSSVISNAITISSTACAAPQATVKTKVSCSNAILTAAPTGVGYTFQWFKDGNTITNATSETYTATENGNYTVTVSNTGSAYSATSAVFPVAVNQINGIVTVSNGQICENSSSITLTSSNVGGSYTHQWYYSPNNVYFEPIASATNNSYTTSLGGFYYDIIKNGTCEVKSNVINTCPISINFIDKTVCNNSVVNVPFTFLGGENQNITLQLVNASTNAVVVANLFSLVSTFSNTYNPSVIIPNSVIAGNYKFRITSGSPTNYSNTSLGIITISGQSGGIAPTVTASLSSVSSSQNVTISATGCQFDVNWDNSDGVSVSSSSFSRLISKNSTFSSTCTDINTGCISQAGSTTVTYNCADAYEPNNSTVAATAIAPNNFTSPVICLNGFDNPDWFSWTLNGHIYYIKASLTSSQVSAGNYKLKLTYDNTNLIIETIPETIGQTLDTYLTLFDTDGVTVLSMNDNENGNGFSKIIYALSNVNPCASALMLNNIIDDYSSGIIIKEANATTGTIAATNKITGTANVTYRAGKSIQLDPGFKADNGVVFKTEFGGCN